MIINSLPIAIGASITTFAATNIDDLVLLIFFSGFRVPRRKIIVGQYLGFGLILGVATMAAIAAWNIPHLWIRVLGLLPVGIGVRHFLQRKTGDAAAQSWSKSRTRSIALLIFSNGADNIAVYVPFFIVGRSFLPTILLTYLVLTAFWCAAGFALARHPIVLRHVVQRGHQIMPLVLVSLGLFILLS